MKSEEPYNHRISLSQITTARLCDCLVLKILPFIHYAVDVVSVVAHYEYYYVVKLLLHDLSSHCSFCSLINQTFL